MLLSARNKRGDSGILGQTSKVILLALLAFAIAWWSTPLREPSTASIRIAYEQFYAELQAKQQVTAADQQRLESLFRQLNAKDTIETELTEIVVRNGVFFLLMVPAVFLAARKLGLGKQQVLAVAGLMGVAFIIQGAVISGAFLAALFAIVGLSCAPKVAVESAPAKQESSDE